MLCIVGPELWKWWSQMTTKPKEHEARGEVTKSLKTKPKYTAKPGACEHKPSPWEPPAPCLPSSLSVREAQMPHTVTQPNRRGREPRCLDCYGHEVTAGTNHDPTSAIVQPCSTHSGGRLNSTHNMRTKLEQSSTCWVRQSLPPHSFGEHDPSEKLYAQDGKAAR